MRETCEKFIKEIQQAMSSSPQNHNPGKSTIDWLSPDGKLADDEE